MGLALFEEMTPTGEELRISKEQELSFNRLLRFLNMHEPTGYEKDEAHKHTVVQCLALRSMLTECKAAKVPFVASALELKRNLHVDIEVNQLLDNVCVRSFVVCKKPVLRRCCVGSKKPRRIPG